MRQCDEQGAQCRRGVFVAHAGVIQWRSREIQSRGVTIGILVELLQEGAEVRVVAEIPTAQEG